MKTRGLRRRLRMGPNSPAAAATAGAEEVAAHARLRQAKLIATLRDQDSLRFLDVRSCLDPEQMFLLPLPSDDLVAGLALATPLSLWCEIPWALAYGTSPLSEDCVVRFETDSLRFRRTVDVEPIHLDERCWIADARGVFTTCAIIASGTEVHRVQLTNRW